MFMTGAVAEGAAAAVGVGLVADESIGEAFGGGRLVAAMMVVPALVEVVKRGEVVAGVAWPEEGAVVDDYLRKNT